MASLEILCLRWSCKIDFMLAKEHTTIDKQAFTNKVAN